MRLENDNVLDLQAEREKTWKAAASANSHYLRNAHGGNSRQMLYLEFTTVQALYYIVSKD